MLLGIPAPLSNPHGLICCWLDPEPRGIERRKEQQDQHRADRRAADQRIGHRSPEDGVREGDEG